MSGLNATILVRDSDSQHIFVNFDPQVQELVKETIYFQKMNLEVPEVARNFLLIENKLEEYIVK